MPRTHLLAVVAAASILTGCAVGPDYVRPPAPVPERFHGVATSPRQQPADPAELATWWTGFHDPLLTRLITAALAQNLDLAQAVARVGQARAGVAAAGAALVPVGAVSGQAAKAYQSGETPLGQVLNSAPGFDRSGSAYEANLGASWELDVAGGLRRAKQAAVADYEASEAGVVAARLTVAAATADIYVAIRGLQARLGIARQQVQTEEELLARISLLHAKGLAPELNVRQAEAGRAEAQAAVPALEVALEVAMNALDVVLGSPPGTHRAEINGVGEIPLPPGLNAIGTPAELLRRRPDLIVAERRLAGASARIGVAVAEYYPKLSITGMLGSATSISSGNLFSSGATQAAGVVGLRWRLFDFGRINAQIEQAKGQEAELLAAYRAAALKATEDVENAVFAMVRRAEQAQALASGVAALTQARAQAMAAYERGVSSQIEVFQADKALLRAADAQAQARTESARATISAYKALGGGWAAGTADTVAAR